MVGLNSMELQVEPASDGSWLVRREGRAPLSHHRSADGAERSARDRAREMGADTIVVRDRYGRVKRLPVRPHRPTA